jgi:GTP-binding protein
MQKLTKLAIVGRPNVGKSALFNRIVKKRIAIVDEAEGITRDRLYAVTDLFGFPFEVIDTGGINSRSKADFNEEIKRQAEIAIEEADTLIMVVDSRVGITDLDKEVASILLRTKKPVCLAVNKIDNLENQNQIYEYYSLGIKKIVGVSATQGLHIAELLEEALASFRDKPVEYVEDESIKISIVGRPNVGKSSLINYLLDEERCIVSPIAGTTRDSIDIPFEHEGQKYVLIDTAGVRRKKAEHEVVDKFAAIRTERAIERADICLLMLDSMQGMTTQEKKIANDIEASGRGCILLFNKWDLNEGFRMEHCLQGIEEEVSFLKHCPKLFISAKTGRNIEKIFPIIKQVYEDSKKRITTHQLNKFVAGALQRNHPPMEQGKRLRIYYMAQVDVQPPVFVFFVNNPQLMVDSYKKYLYNQFRDTYGFVGVPIIFHLKGKDPTKRDHQKNRPDVLDLAKKGWEEEAPLEDEEFDESDFDDMPEYEHDNWDFDEER